MARCALRTGNELHRAGAAMFLMAGRTAILDRVRFMKGMGPFTDAGMAGLAAIIDFLDSIGGSAPAKTVTKDLSEFFRGQTAAGHERFIMTSVAIRR